MDSKYSQKDILDITKVFIQDYSDLQAFRKMLYAGTDFPLPKDVSGGEAPQNSDHDIINAASLAKLGERILNDGLFASCNAYHLSLPSVNTPGINHALALMVDNQTKEIWYQDSYGIDMRRELRDFFKELLPDHKITYFTQIQQYKQKNDSSCVLLCEYNLLDMWQRKKGHPEKMHQFDSFEAREAAWPLVEQIVMPVPQTKKTPKFRFMKKEPAQDPKRYLIERNRNTQRYFKYRITSEKDYREQIKTAAATARNKHAEFRREMTERHLIQRMG